MLVAAAVHQRAVRTVLRHDRSNARDSHDPACAVVLGVLLSFFFPPWKLQCANISRCRWKNNCRDCCLSRGFRRCSLSAVCALVAPISAEPAIALEHVCALALVVVLALGLLALALAFLAVLAFAFPLLAVFALDRSNVHAVGVGPRCVT